MYFLKTQNARAFHCLLLKNTKVKIEKSQEKEMAVKEINIAFSTPIPILSENAFSTFNFQNAPLNWSEVAFKFLQPANHHNHNRLEVTGKRVNRGAGLRLEISVNYFSWRCKSYNMGEKYLGKVR